MENPRPWLAFGDIELANPFALALDPAVSKAATVPKIPGKIHGDLHPDNILVPSTLGADPDEYWLVDLSRYRHDAAVAWDPAYLATTITAMLLSSFNSYERRELTSLMIDPTRRLSEKGLSGLHGCMAAIHGAAMRFAGRGLKTEWRRQAPLCLLASSLVLSGRTIIPARDREWFFWLAAHAATDFVRKAGLGDPTDPLRLPDRLIDSIPTIDPGPLAGAGGLDATPRSDQDVGEAVILRLPADFASGGEMDIAAPEQSTSRARTVFDAALRDASAGLSTLRNQCGPPSQLEANIGKFLRTLESTSRSVQRLQDTCTPALRQAIGAQFRKVEFAADAFQEHVQLQPLRGRDDYIRSRTNLVRELIEVIDETISYFALLE